MLSAVLSKRKPELLIWAGLAVAVLWLTVYRLALRNDLRENDCSLYAVIAQEISRGETLYVDVWDHKPPTIYLLYALGEAVFGTGPALIVGLGVLGAMGVALGVFFCARRLGASSFAALAATGCWAVICGDARLDGVQPNAELFINACQVWLLFFLLRWRDGERRLTRIVLPGAALIFIASSLKPTAVALPGCLALALLATCPDRRGFFRDALDLLRMAALAACGWVALFGYFYAAGRLDVFWFAVFTFNGAYAGGLWGNLAAGLCPANLCPAGFGALWTLVPVYVLAVVAAFRDGKRETALLLIALAVAEYLMIAAPGRFFSHYYQYALPPLAIGAGLALDAALKTPELWKRRGAAAVAAALAATLVARELRFLALPENERTRTRYGVYGDFLAYVPSAAESLKTLLKPDEAFYLWGFELDLYRLSGKRPPARVMYHFHLTQPPFASLMTRLLTDDLTKTPPEAIVVAKYALPLLRNHPAGEWFARRYVTFSGSNFNPGFLLFVRENGRIAREKAASRP